MPAAVAKAGEGGRVTFAGFLESIKAFEACLRRGEVLGLSSTGRNGNCAGPLVAERSHTKQILCRVRREESFKSRAEGMSVLT